MTCCGCCWSTSVVYSLNLFGLFVLNGTDGALEGHNIDRTSPRLTSQYLYCQELSVTTDKVRGAYARVRVLSTNKTWLHSDISCRMLSSLSACQHDNMKMFHI